MTRRLQWIAAHLYVRLKNNQTRYINMNSNLILPLLILPAALSGIAVGLWAMWQVEIKKISLTYIIIWIASGLLIITAKMFLESTHERGLLNLIGVGAFTVCGFILLIRKLKIKKDI